MQNTEKNSISGSISVALDDAVPPRPGIEGLGGFARLPLVDPAGSPVIAADEVLADQPRHVAEAGRDLMVVVAAGRPVDGRRQRIADDGANHGVLPAFVPGAAR